MGAALHDATRQYTMLCHTMLCHYILYCSSFFDGASRPEGLGLVTCEIERSNDVLLIDSSVSQKFWIPDADVVDSLADILHSVRDSDVLCLGHSGCPLYRSYDAGNLPICRQEGSAQEAYVEPLKT